MNTIEEFIEELRKQKNTDTVTNPYLEKKVAENLNKYIKAMMNIEGERILLVGEAPGHKGCKITGIPFTSGRIFENIDHPLLKNLKNDLYLSKIESENTATIVWKYLATKNNTPLFWNSYPFHPHPNNILDKNRTPNNDEINKGIYFLKAIKHIYKPTIIAGIGNSGVECAQRAFPDMKIDYIRHPSFGGKSDFIKGMDKII